MIQEPDTDTTGERRVAVLGAGPVGLDAALAFADAGWRVTVSEAGSAVAAHVRQWGHVRLFTPWALNVSARMRAHLTNAGLSVPGGEDCPTGAELVDRVLDPVAALPVLADRIRLGRRVAAVARSGLLKHEHIGSAARAAAPFRLLIDTPDGEQVQYADLVLDCTGTYGTPNSLGDGGIPAPGERALGGRITRTLPSFDDPDRWAGTVLLVGAGKSAQTAARALAGMLGVRTEWIVRDPSPDWGAVPDDSLPARQQLVETSQALALDANDHVTVWAGTGVQALRPVGDRIGVTLAAPQGVREITADHVLALTGYVGDASMYRQLQVHECYATGAPMNLSAALLGSAGGDCLAQPAVGIDVLRNPEPQFFIIGAKSYGRMNTFLLRTGYGQVDQIAAAYAGWKAEAAQRVS